MEDRIDHPSLISGAQAERRPQSENEPTLNSEAEHSGVWAQLHAEYYDKLVRGLIATYGSGPPDPEDIAQRTFLKLNERKTAQGIRDLRAFAWTIARNFMISEKRSLRMRADHAYVERALVADECDTIDPERVLMGKEEVAVVTKALDAMPDRRRQIFLACRVEGLTPKAAGERCGVSRSSAVRHLALATETIAAAFKKQRQSQTKRGLP